MIAQEVFINKLLDDQDYSVIIKNNLSDKFFPDCKTEYNFIKAHYDQYGKVPDKFTFCSAFPDFSIHSVSEPAGYVLSQLLREYNLNHVVNSYNNIKKLIESGQEDKALEVFASASQGLQSGKVMSATNIVEDTSRFQHYQEKMQNPNKYYLSTGLKELDEILGGLDIENEDFVCAARPGLGKTWMMLVSAVQNAVEGCNVGIYEGEITTDKLAYRIDTLVSHISNKGLMRGDSFVLHEYADYIENINHRIKGNIHVLTPNDVPEGEVTTDTLEAFIDQYKLDVLYIDQYSLLEDHSPCRTESERVGNIAKKIKALQVKKRMPIYSLSQMNRTKNENGEKDTTQIAGSDKIPQYATTLLMLDQKYDENLRQVQLTIDIAKARDGGDHKKLTYVADFNTGRFTYIPVEGDGISTEAGFQETEARYASYPADDDVPF